MDQRLKRVLNAFVIGFAGTALSLLLNVWLELTSAAEQNNWASVKTLVFSIIAGAVLAGLRALQAYAPVVPSPEPEENNDDAVV